MMTNRPISATGYLVWFTMIAFAFMSKPVLCKDKGISGEIKRDTYAGYYVEIVNDNSFFACIDDSMFDTRYGYIQFIDLKNKSRQISRVSTPSGPPQSKQRYQPTASYFILEPQETRSFFIKMSNFDFQVGQYEYQLKLNAYRCSDIVDEKRFKEQRPVKVFAIENRGGVDFDAEFVKMNNIQYKNAKNF